MTYFDYSLLAVILFLCCFGLVMVYSSSSYAAQLKSGDSLFYLKKQGGAFLVGIAVMIAVACVDYHKYAKVAVLGLSTTARSAGSALERLLFFRRQSRSRWP